MGEYVLCGYFLEPGPEPLVLGIAGDGYAEEAVIRPKAAGPRAIARELLLTPEELSKGLTWAQAAGQVLSGAEDGSHILTLAVPQVIVSKLRSWAREAGRTLTFADITSACALAWPAAGSVTAASICASAGIDPGPLRGPQAQAEAVLQALPGLKRALARDAAPALLADCQARGELLEWPLAPGFAEIVAAAVEHLRSSRDPATLEEALNSPDRPRRPRRPAEGVVSGAQAVEAALGPGGSVEATMPGYESRPRQLEMAMTVAGAVDRDEILLAEAGTGIGKSLAYLIPLALHVTATGERALVSTATRTLQDQLLDHDVPLVRRALDLDLAVTVMKGRTNYI
ncbi:MAG: DEAD/DEAH box helicase, partial [Armatimonadia bacterium]|nr:DEAD/DEAH box helicase [Armatimonadia bacterium]